MSLQSANKESANALLKACFQTLFVEAFSPLIPRLAYSAFNFTQPWLMRRLLKYINDRKLGTAQDMDGLMGAFVIVYLGLAVRSPRYPH